MKYQVQLHEITDELALNSNKGGDSDADDDLTKRYSSSSFTTTIRTSSAQSTDVLEYIEKSNDLVDDPNYRPE